MSMLEENRKRHQQKQQKRQHGQLPEKAIFLLQQYINNNNLNGLRLHLQDHFDSISIAELDGWAKFYKMSGDPYVIPCSSHNPLIKFVVKEKVTEEKTPSFDIYDLYSEKRVGKKFKKSTFAFYQHLHAPFNLLVIRRNKLPIILIEREESDYHKDDVILKASPVKDASWKVKQERKESFWIIYLYAF